MLTRLAIRIQERFSALTASEQALATHILGHQHEVIGLSASELARGAGVSKSTAARFFRSLGYEDFDAVRRQAREELNRAQPTLAGPETAARPARTGTPEAYLAQETTNLTRTLEGLSSDALRAAVEVLAGAARVWCTGFGADAPLARLAVQLLGTARADVLLLDDGMVEVEANLASLAPRDALVLLTLPPRPRRAAFVLEQAEAVGAGIVTITDTGGPAPAAARATIRCHVWSEPGRPSLTPVTSVLQFLATRVAAKLGARAENRTQLIDSLREAAEDAGR